ncbi:MAG: SLC13 family permease [Candidatus Hydrogenedentes bacterium]|nr:SLC13 family permease [Candidatus Hydrogenedentota bacterium]
MGHSYIALGVFVLAYGLFVAFPARRSLVAVVAGVVLIVTRTIPLGVALTEGINWNVMGIFVGTLIAADYFIESRTPAYLAEVIVNKAPNTAWAILFICLLTGFISAFVENVATVLIVAPVALSLARKLRINPVNMMIGIAISSNLQGTATLIGDPPSMLLGGFAKMTFMDFFFYHGKLSIFFAVELGALFSFVVLYWFFRKETEKVPVVPTEVVKTWVPAAALVLLIVSLAVSSFFDTGFSYLAGMICMGFGVFLLVWGHHVHKMHFLRTLKRLDWDTTFFLMGIFIIVASLSATGWIDRISDVLSRSIGQNVFLGYTLLVFFSVVVSAFVDNVPFLAAMLPVGLEMSERLGLNPSLYLFGLLIGASLGGNITPIGASANIVAAGLLKKEGYHLTFRQFGRISVPFTLAAVIPAYLLIWFIWR